MSPFMISNKKRLFHKLLSVNILTAFILTSLNLPVQAQVLPELPQPGVRVNLSPEYTPAYLKGMVISPNNPLQFDFLVYQGDKPLEKEAEKEEYQKLIKYFLASLAVPDDHQWVNLSPYEKDRIIQDDFGKTEMGRDLLSQDYILKQITASLIYPESQFGKDFWDKIYARAYQEFGSTNIPVNTFNKVWIMPDEARIYEQGNTVYIVKQRLKVMLEEDYLSLSKHSGITSSPSAPKGKEVNALGSQIVREIILPALEKEVNEGKNFAMLRQVYSGMLLAAWYKRSLKETLLGKIYADQARLKGVDQKDQKTNQAIYQQYLKAFKKGVFNYIKEDIDKYTQQAIPRKYFSGGTESWGLHPDRMMNASPSEVLGDLAMTTDKLKVVEAQFNRAATQERDGMMDATKGIVYPEQQPSQQARLLAQRLRDKPWKASFKQPWKIVGGWGIDLDMYTREDLPYEIRYKVIEWQKRNYKSKGLLENMGTDISEKLGFGITDLPRGIIAYQLKGQTLVIHIRPSKQYVEAPDNDRGAAIELGFDLDRQDVEEVRQALQSDPSAVMTMFQELNQSVNLEGVYDTFLKPSSRGFYLLDMNERNIDDIKRKIEQDTRNPPQESVTKTEPVIEALKEPSPAKENPAAPKATDSTPTQAPDSAVQKTENSRVNTAFNPNVTYPVVVDQETHPASALIDQINGRINSGTDVVSYNQGMIRENKKSLNRDKYPQLEDWMAELLSNEEVGVIPYRDQRGYLLYKHQPSASGGAIFAIRINPMNKDPERLEYQDEFFVILRIGNNQDAQKIIDDPSLLPFLLMRLEIPLLPEMIQNQMSLEDAKEQGGEVVQVRSSNLNGLYIGDPEKLQYMLFAALLEENSNSLFRSDSNHSFPYAQVTEGTDGRKTYKVKAPFMGTDARGGQVKFLRVRYDNASGEGRMERFRGQSVTVNGKSITLDDSGRLDLPPSIDEEGNLSLEITAPEGLLHPDRLVVDLWRGDAAMGANRSTKDRLGGIDLNAENLNMLIRRDGKGIVLPLPEQDLERFKIEGLVPQIMSIKPISTVTDLAALQPLAA